MKNIILFFVLLFIISLGTVRAGSGFELRFGGGVVKLSKPHQFATTPRLGPSIHAGLSYQMTSFAGLLLSLDFHRHLLDKEHLRENLIMQERMGIDDEIRGGNSSVLSLSVNTVLYLLPRTSALAVYLVGGGGYFKFTTDQLIVGKTTFPRQSEITWTLAGGGGFDIPLSTVLALFVEGKYGVGYTQDEQSRYLTGSVGVKFER